MSGAKTPQSSESSSSAERRRDRRLGLSVPVRYLPVEIGSKRTWRVGMTSNVSRGGAFFLVDSPREVDEELDLCWRMAETLGRFPEFELRAKGKVVRVIGQRDPSGGDAFRHGIAVTFIEAVQCRLSPSSSQSIRDQLKDL